MNETKPRFTVELNRADGSTYFEVLNSHEAKLWEAHGYIVTVKQVDV